MNKITAKQLIRLNGTVTARNEVPISEKQKKILEEIAQSPYILDEKFFYVYKTTIEKSAKLGCELINRKPFDNGNGKTALLASLTLLDLNGFKLTPYQDDLKSLAESMQNNDVEACTEWIRQHLADNIYIMPKR